MSTPEHSPLLPSTNHDEQSPAPAPAPKPRRRATALLMLLALVGGCLFIGIRGEKPFLPKDPLARAHYFLSSSPVIDGHIDVPELARTVFGNDLDAFDLRKETVGHFDIPRIRKGKLGGLFWSCYVDCKPSGPDFLAPTNRVRDTLEQLDIAKLMIERYADVFAFATTAKQVRRAMREGKVASLLGVEGAHQLGNSLAALRQYYDLGVRYMTLTHSCNNAFADSAGIFEPIMPVHHGLSPLGRDLIYEMNRLGMLVDISHVSDETAAQALEITQAPVIWSHSASRHFNNISRNVPDYILKHIGAGKHQVDGVVMVNIYPAFMLPPEEQGKASVGTVADHVEYMARLIGKKYIGIGSDFDGIETVPKGMEDVSKYPKLFAELIRRGGWSQRDLAGLAGENVLRVLEGAEKTAAKMKKDGAGPSMAIYDKRTDIRRGNSTRGRHGL